MEEVWKDVEGYEGKYQVSNMGRVRSLDMVVASVHPKTGEPIAYHQEGRILTRATGVYRSRRAAERRSGSILCIGSWQGHSLAVGSVVLR